MLVARVPIGPDEIIEQGDLIPLSVPARIGAVGISASELDDYIGRRTVGPVGGGSLVHPDQFIDVSESGVEETIVGVALPPGENPQFGLRAGDIVTVYELGDNNVGFGDGTASGANEITTAEVVRVSALQQPDYFLLSLKVDVAVAELVVERSAQDRIAVALLEEDVSGVDGLDFEDEFVGDEAPSFEPEELDGGLVVDESPVEEDPAEEDVAAAAEEEG